MQCILCTLQLVYLLHINYYSVQEINWYRYGILHLSFLTVYAYTYTIYVWATKRKFMEISGRDWNVPDTWGNVFDTNITISNWLEWH